MIMTPAPQKAAQAPVAQATTTQALAGKAEVIALITHLSGVMDELLAVIDKETQLVRAGKVSEATQLSQRKTDLAAAYMTDATRLKANPAMLSQLATGEVETLRRQHDLFHALLQINLTVLATAHAVSEGIMRGVHEEVTRKAVPQTYGASGRHAAPPRSASQPLTVSRVL
jgi:soluble cytochrome b562